MTEERGMIERTGSLTNLVKKIVETGRGIDVNWIVCECSLVSFVQAPAIGKVIKCPGCGIFLKGAKKTEKGK